MRSKVLPKRRRALHGTGGSQVSFSLSVSLVTLTSWRGDSVTILICFFALLQTPPGRGPWMKTRTSTDVVQRSGEVVGVSIWLVMRDWRAWKSTSNFGSPLSRAWSTVMEFTPLSVQRGSNVLLAQTAIGNTHTPFTRPSASHGSPSVHRILFGFASGAVSGPAKTRKPVLFELPPPPKTTAGAGAAARSHTPATIASDQVPPRIGSVLPRAVRATSTKFPWHVGKPRGLREGTSTRVPRAGAAS